MAKKQVKETLKSKITKGYIDYVLNYGQSPSNVYTFCKDLKIKEDQFYTEYGSFEAIDADIFKQFFTNTIEVLEKSPDYKDFDGQNKLLSFYFTFFEVLKANRSYVTAILENKKDMLKSIGILAALRHDFKEYLDELELNSMDLKIEKLEELQSRGTTEFFWAQMLVILKFWLDDGSANFEKTDMFIEKSVTTSFELMNTAPLNSVIDLAKFLFKEKMNPVA
jgi:hypothetical protein